MRSVSPLTPFSVAATVQPITISIVACPHCTGYAGGADDQHRQV